MAGRGDRGAGGRPAGLHAGGGGHLRTGEPGRGGGQPAGRAGGRARPRCSAWPAGCSGWSGRRSAGCAAPPRRGAWPGSWPSPSTARRCRPRRCRWGTGPAALVALTAVTALVALAGPRLLRRPVAGRGRRAACWWRRCWCGRRPSGGHPRAGCWSPATSARATRWCCAPGPGQAVVVDAGPDPRAVDRCLDRLGVRDVPLLVLTHFHADHVDGIAGVFDGPRVGAVQTTRLLDPPGGVAEVDGRVPGRRAGAAGGDVRRDDGGRRGHGPGAVAAAGLTDPRPRRRVDRQRRERRAAGRGRRAPAAAHR